MSLQYVQAFSNSFTEKFRQIRLILISKWSCQLQIPNRNFLFLSKFKIQIPLSKTLIRAVALKGFSRNFGWLLFESGKKGITVVFTVGRSKPTGRSVAKNRPRPTDFDRPRTLFSKKKSEIFRGPNL